jgi:2-polyprenyl-6-methoxyphenol hydroxylase-like FAD-dependent oxidoreductase
MASKTQEHANAAAYQRSLKELPAPAETIEREKYDVVIVGAGPAGLFSGAALARFGWDVLVVDNRPEPTIAGRAGTYVNSDLDLCFRWGTASHNRSFEEYGSNRTGNDGTGSPML